MFPYYQQPILTPQNYYPQQRMVTLPEELPRIYQPLSPIRSQKLPYFNQNQPQMFYQPSFNMPFSPRIQDFQMPVKPLPNFYSPRFEPPKEIRHQSIPKNIIRAQFLAMRPASLQEIPQLNVDRRLPFNQMKQGFIKNGEIIMLKPQKPINSGDSSPNSLNINLGNIQPVFNQNVEYDKIKPRKPAKRKPRPYENNENIYPLHSDRIKESPNHSVDNSTNHETPNQSDILSEVKPSNKNGNKVIRRARTMMELHMDRKQKALRRLRILAWLMAYPRLLYMDVKISCIEKKDYKGREIQEKFEHLVEKSEDHIFRAARTEIWNMLNDKDYDFIFVGAKKCPKVDTMGDVLATHLKYIFNKIINYSKSLPKYYIKKLAELSENGCYLPDDYFTEFEMKRFQFSHFGNLKHTMSWHSKIIIAGIVLFRGLILSVFWYGNAIQEYKQKNYKKLLNIVSFLYNVCFEYVKNLAATYKGNKDNIADELKVTNAAHLSATTEEERTKHKIKKEPGRELEIVEGFYGKTQLELLFGRKDLVDGIKVLVDCWLELLYEQTHEEWGNIVKLKKKSKTVKFNKPTVFEF